MSRADSNPPSIANDHGRLVPFTRRTLSNQSQNGHQPHLISAGVFYPIAGQVNPQRPLLPAGSHYRSFSEPFVSSSSSNGPGRLGSHLTYPFVPTYSFTAPQLGPQPVTPPRTGYSGSTLQIVPVAQAPYLFTSPVYPISTSQGTVVPFQGIAGPFPNGYSHHPTTSPTAQLMSSNDMAAGFQRTSGDARRYITTNPVRTENRPPMNGVLCRNGPQCRKFQEGPSSLFVINDVVNLQLTGTCNFNHDFSSASADLLGA